MNILPCVFCVYEYLSSDSFMHTVQALAEPSIYIHQIFSTVNTSGSFNLFDLGY